MTVASTEVIAGISILAFLPRPASKTKVNYLAFKLIGITTTGHGIIEYSKGLLHELVTLTPYEYESSKKEEISFIGDYISQKDDG